MQAFCRHHGAEVRVFWGKEVKDMLGAARRGEIALAVFYRIMDLWPLWEDYEILALVEGLEVHCPVVFLTQPELSTGGDTRLRREEAAKVGEFAARVKDSMKKARKAWDKLQTLEDREVVSELIKDPRIKFVDLAEALGVSLSTLKRRRREWGLPMDGHRREGLRRRGTKLDRVRRKYA